MTSLIYSQSTLVIAAVLFTALALAIEVGFRIGCKHEGRFNAPVRGTYQRHPSLDARNGRTAIGLHVLAILGAV